MMSPPTRVGISGLKQLEKNHQSSSQCDFNAESRGWSSTKLQRDLLNSPLHCFGCHQNCSPDFCKTVRQQLQQPQQQQLLHIRHKIVLTIQVTVRSEWCHHCASAGMGWCHWQQKPRWHQEHTDHYHWDRSTNNLWYPECHHPTCWESTSVNWYKITVQKTILHHR